MNDLKELEDFRAAVGPPDAGVLARARTRMLAPGTEPAAVPRRRARLGWRLAVPNRRIVTLAGLGAVAAGAAVAVALTLIPAATPSPAPAGHVRLDAEVVLQRAAAAYLSIPAPRGDQYIYTEVRVGSRGTPTSLEQAWRSADGSRPNVDGVSPCRQVPAHMKMSEKLRKYYDNCEFSATVIPGPRAETTYSGMLTLPRNPAGVLAYLARHNACRGYTQADGEWGQVAGIFQLNPVVPPAFGAALLRAAAQIPGVRVLTKVSFAGSTYVGVARTLPPGPTESLNWNALIFDPHTYRLVGLENAWSDHPITNHTNFGSDEGTTVLLQAKVVDSAPVIPSDIGLLPSVPGPPLSCGPM